MLGRISAALTGALVLIGVLAYPFAAAACLDLGGACDDSIGWTKAELVNGAGVPTDGVLLFELGAVNQPAFVPADFELEVTLDGAPVPGAFESLDVERWVAWRPAQPLVPGAVYVGAGNIHNGADDPRCVPALVPIELEFVTGPGPTAPLVAPDILTKEKVVAAGPEQLDNVVCCDGGMAAIESFGCAGPGPVTFDDGFCALISTTGELEVSVKVTPPNESSINLALVAGLVVDGVPQPARHFGATSVTLQSSLPAPHCVEVVLRDLATGATLTSPKSCHGADVAEQLGPQTLQPDAGVLVERCAGSPYTCAQLEGENSWDPEQCTPWPAGEGGSTGSIPTTGEPGAGESTGTTTGPGEQGLVDHGCTCTGGATRSHDALLGLLLFAAARRRRRVTQARACSIAATTASGASNHGA